MAPAVVQRSGRGLSHCFTVQGGVLLAAAWGSGRISERPGAAWPNLTLVSTPTGVRQKPPLSFPHAFGLGVLREVQLLTSRFAESEATILDCIAIFEDLGWRVWAVRRSIVLARARLHAGEYRADRILAGKVVSLAREVGWGRGVTYTKLVPGEVALVEADFAQTYRTLQESLLVLKEFAEEPWDVNPSA